MTGTEDLERIAAAISRSTPGADESVPATRKAAVAVVLRPSAEGLALLFIRRAEHPRDPWSGHMAFPGGRVEETDADPFATALRESREELGLDLPTHARFLGRLSEARTHLRPGGVPRCVVPFVFALADIMPELAPNHEVQEALWVPLGFLADRGNRGWFAWRRGPVVVPMPAFHWQGRIIWGLTLRIIDEMLLRAAGESG